MKKLTSQQIREMWLSFFEWKDHYVISSSSLIPIDDPSLLFINSGVATLKKYFSGEDKAPSQRMVNAQKAIRTGDIENIGKTSRHHTMFEMLGNFSIGDYFKKEAIDYAWELLTSKEYFGMDKDKIFVTVFRGNEKIPFDQEIYDYWISKGLNANHIFKMPEENNFWDMGQGPCGPCTEIFFDRGEKYSSRSAQELIGQDIENDRFIEIWNIVFSEFNNDGKKNYTLLPQKNIDTGAGLERIASILQDTPTNFETDLFMPIITEIEKYSSHKYFRDYIPGQLAHRQEQINAAYKAIADFTRAIVFAICDGVVPSNTGRGYVIRRLIRKALIKSRILEIQEPFMHKLVNIINDIMGTFYQSISKNLNIAIDKIKFEEDSFYLNLLKAIKTFEQVLTTNNIEKVMPSELAFKLYETYGLPYEVLEDLLNERGIKLNKDEFDLEQQKFIDLSKQNAKKTEAMSVQVKTFQDLESTKFVGYDMFEIGARVLSIEKAEDGKVIVALDQTPFYATSGGQEFDEGTINGIEVLNVTKNNNNVFMHLLDATSVQFKPKDVVNCAIDIERRKSITKNHSAVHLLFAALEKYFQVQIPQVGSKVEEDFFRFDFAFHIKPTEEQLDEVLKIVNSFIRTGTASQILEVTQQEAKEMGATFLDGTKYGKIVRVVKFGDFALDLCGGTHVKAVSEIEEVGIVSLESKGSGIYRITGITGRENIKNAIININRKLFNFTKTEQTKKISMSKKLLVEFKLNELSKEFDKDITAFETVDLTQPIGAFKKELDFNLKKLREVFANINLEVTNSLTKQLLELPEESETLKLNISISDNQMLYDSISKALSSRKKGKYFIDSNSAYVGGFNLLDESRFDEEFKKIFSPDKKPFRRINLNPIDKTQKIVIYGHSKNN